MDRYHVETWRYLRDHAKPVTWQDMADLVKVRTFEPPSPAHRKRIALGGHGHVPEPRDYPDPSPFTVQNRTMNEFFKAQMSLLGGTRTVAPAPEPCLVRREQMLTHISPLRNQDATEPDYAGRFRMGERKHLRELAKRVYVDDQPDMFRVLDAYGSFEAYGRD